jgi:hypothetical protein
VELVVARQAREISQPYSGCRCWHPAPERRGGPAPPATRSWVAATSERVARPRLIRECGTIRSACAEIFRPRLARLTRGERAGCSIVRFYRAAAERRGNLPLVVLRGAAMSIDWQRSQVLTYISIGFSGILIYAGIKLKGGYNMLLIVRVGRASGRAVPGGGRGLSRAVEDLRTLATKCCHNLWRSGSAWMQIGAIGSGRDYRRHRRIARERVCVTAGRGIEVTRVIPGFTTSYTIPGKRSTISVVL